MVVGTAELTTTFELTEAIEALAEVFTAIDEETTALVWTAGELATAELATVPEPAPQVATAPPGAVYVEMSKPL